MIRLQRLNNTYIIVRGSRGGPIEGFEYCWTGERWTIQLSFAKRFPTRIEAQAELERCQEKTPGT